jgi:hypothetical protein
MLESFQRTYRSDGFRHSLGWRTKPISGRGRYGTAWTVQRWNGEHWVEIDVVESYADAREVPDRWRKNRERST